LVISAVVVYLAVMMLTFAIVVSKRTRGRKHRSIQEGCLMGGRRTASFVSAPYLILQRRAKSAKFQ
uniref:Secreted protein n=1 Tax=Rodentolepis nana TaxID=102285 RepID=A0A0R3T4H7_RODNA